MMRRTVVLMLAVATIAFPAAQANAGSSATPTLAQFKALQSQVKSLQAQVKTLQKWVPKSCSTNSCFTLPQVSSVAALNYEVEICQQAVIADAFQGTWNVIDQISAATQAGKTYFGTQTPITDSSACSNVRVTRSSGIPPTVAIFSSLITLLTT
jgi:hypothetical protein